MEEGEGRGEGLLRNSLFEPLQPGDVELCFEEERIGLVLTGIDRYGNESDHPDAPCAYVEVSGVAPDSPAAAHPALRRGHMLKSIQGENVVGLSFNTTVDALVAASRPLTIIVGCPPAPQLPLPPAQPPQPHPALPALEEQLSQLAADLQRERETNSNIQRQLESQAAETAAAMTAATAASSVAQAAQAAADEAARVEAERRTQEEHMASETRAKLAAAMQAEAAAEKERSRREAEERAAVEAEARERTLREQEAAQRKREEREKYIPEAVAARQAAAEDLCRVALAEQQRVAADDEHRVAELNARLVAIGVDTLTNHDKAGEVARIGEFPPPKTDDTAQDATVATLAQCGVATAIKAVLVGASGADSGAVVGVHGHDGCGKTTVLHEVANDGTVRAAFPDGVFMLRLGTDPDPASLQTTLVRLLGELTPFHDQADLFVRNFGELRALLILDDVLAAHDARSFVTGLASCTSCRLLLAAPTRQILTEAGVVPACMFGVRPTVPEHLLKILGSQSSWTDRHAADGMADERARCLELGRATKGVQLVIQTLAAHIVAGVDTKTLCERVRDAGALRLERRTAQWEREAGEQFDAGGTAVDRQPAMPDSDREDHRGTLAAAPPMPLTDSDDEQAQHDLPTLPPHSSDEEGEPHFETSGDDEQAQCALPTLPLHSSDEEGELHFESSGVPVSEPEPEHAAQGGLETLVANKCCMMSDKDRSVSELLLQGSFDVLSACFTTLDDTVQRRCAELAAFPAAVPVPLVTLHRIWSQHNMDYFACEHLLQHLASRGWLQRCCFQGDQTYAIVMHPIISDFLIIWWRVNRDAQDGEDVPALSANKHLIREWTRSRELVGWGVDGGYWLRHMLRHFRGAGLQFRRCAMCAVFSIHWLEFKIALCEITGALSDLGAAFDAQGYEWTSLLYNGLMLDVCGAAPDTTTDVGEGLAPALPTVHPPPVVTESQPQKLKGEAAALFRRLLSDSESGPSDEHVESSDSRPCGPLAAPEDELRLSEVAMPSDHDIDRLRRCVRDCLSLLARWPGSLRQQLIMHLQRAGEEGGVSVPMQRFLRSALHDPARAGTWDTTSCNLFGIIAEWNCGNQSWQSSAAILGPSGQHLRREGAMSEVSALQVLRVDIDRAGKLAASCCANGSVSLWDMRGVEPLSKNDLRYAAGGGNIVGLAINDDGTRMVTHTSDTVSLYDVSLPSVPRIVHELPRATHTNIITSVAICGDGTKVATSCGDNIVRVFNIGASETSVVEMRGHREWVSGVSMSADGNTLVSWSDHEVCVWSSSPPDLTRNSAPTAVPSAPHRGPPEDSPSAQVVAPVPLPSDPANHTDQERWLDQVMSAAASAVPVSSPTVDPGSPPALLDYTKVELPLEALATQEFSISGLVVEQAELGKDGSCLVLRYRSEQAGDGGSDASAFAIWELGAPSPMHIVDGLKSRLQDVRIADQLALTCCDDGELLLWEWNEAEVSVASRWTARFGGLNTCALSWKGKVAACGLAGGVTALLARQVSQWEVLPSFVGIAKMAPDDWEECCQVTRTPFTRWTRRHHCRRCGRLICNDASVLGAPKSEHERENALRQIRRSRTMRLTLQTNPELSSVSSDEEDQTTQMASESAVEFEPQSEPELSGLLDSAKGSAERLTAPLEETIVQVKLARLRRCIDCVAIDAV